MKCKCGFLVFAGVVVVCLIVYVIVKEVTSKTKVVEVVRDERGYIREVIERVV